LRSWSFEFGPIDRPFYGGTTFPLYQIIFSCLDNEEQSGKYIPKTSYLRMALELRGFDEPNTGFRDAGNYENVAIKGRGDLFVLKLALKTFITHWLHQGMWR